MIWYWPLPSAPGGADACVTIVAATELFGKQDWAGTGKRDVARAAGVSIETVYGNFRSIISC